MYKALLWTGGCSVLFAGVMFRFTSKRKKDWKVSFESFGESQDVEEISQLIFTLANMPLVGGPDQISKRGALTSLQGVLKRQFGRECSFYDDHGVRNFTVSRTTENLGDDEVITFNKFTTTGRALKEQARSIALYYVEGLTDEEEIQQSYLNKERGRYWSNIYSKHFVVALSEVFITHDSAGASLTTADGLKTITLATAVGFDVSAHRLTGVHFGDLLRYIEGLPGGELEHIVEEALTGNTPAADTQFWKLAYNGWQTVHRVPAQLFRLKEDVLFNDYCVQFSLLFHALESAGVEAPVIAAIGCGVFGWAFPGYQAVVARAITHVLSSHSYNFKVVTLCEISERNLTIFGDEFRKATGKLRVPLTLVGQDMLSVARALATQYTTSIHNAGDLWEYGQFWEGGGSLEEYIARMTTGYLSQHYRLNPRILSSLHPVSHTKLATTDEAFDELKSFIDQIREKGRKELNH